MIHLNRYTYKCFSLSVLITNTNAFLKQVSPRFRRRKDILVYSKPPYCDRQDMRDEITNPALGRPNSPTAIVRVIRPSFSCSRSANSNYDQGTETDPQSRTRWQRERDGLLARRTPAPGSRDTARQRSNQTSGVQNCCY